MHPNTLLTLQIILTIVTILAVLFGWLNNARNSIKKRTEYEINLTRDIGDIRAKITSIEGVIGNGTGLKADVRQIKNDLIQIYGQITNIERAFEKVGILDTTVENLKEHYAAICADLNARMSAIEKK